MERAGREGLRVYLLGAGPGVAQKAGEVSEDVDAKMAAYLILGSMNWAYTWYRPEGRVSPRTLGKLAADLAINGLRGSAR